MKFIMQLLFMQVLLHTKIILLVNYIFLFNLHVCVTQWCIYYSRYQNIQREYSLKKNCMPWHLELLSDVWDESFLLMQ